MDKKSPIPDEAEQILGALRDLYNSGQVGFLILVVAFLVVVGLLVYLLYAQRQALSFVDIRIKAVDSQMKGLDAYIKTIDTQMKAADAIRAESRSSQEISAKEISNRVETLATINDDLRKELERIKNSQNMLADTQRGLIASHKQLKEDVKAYIDLGLDDIKERMSSVTVTRLIDQLPQAMKSEIDVTMKSIYDSVAKTAAQHFQTISADSVAQSEFIKMIEERLRTHITNQLSGAISGRIHQELDVFRYHYGSDYLDAVADRITLRLESKLRPRFG